MTALSRYVGCFPFFLSFFFFFFLLLEFLTGKKTRHSGLSRRLPSPLTHTGVREQSSRLNNRCPMSKGSLSSGEGRHSMEHVFFNSVYWVRNSVKDYLSHWINKYIEAQHLLTRFSKLNNISKYVKAKEMLISIKHYHLWFRIELHLWQRGKNPNSIIIFMLFLLPHSFLIFPI